VNLFINALEVVSRSDRNRFELDFAELLVTLVTSLKPASLRWCTSVWPQRAPQTPQ
jgi:hypothetical protein